MRGGLTRRATLAGAGACLAGGRAVGATLAPAVEALERKLGGRVGVATWDLGTRARAGYRTDERFPVCSTFKTLLAGAVLARIDRGDEDLSRRIAFAPDDVVAFSPVTRERVHGDGMAIVEIAEAMVSRGDNTAANLLLASMGGPPALTGWLRGIGDEVTRLDRTETALNEALPGDPRDTTSPSAMLDDIQRLLFGDVLTQASKDRLAAWLLANNTGDKRLRAGLPKTWRVGDRTGTGANGAASAVAVAWPPGGAPLLVAAYLHGSKAGPAELDAAIAAIGRLAASPA